MRVYVPNRVKFSYASSTRCQSMHHHAVGTMMRCPCRPFGAHWVLILLAVVLSISSSDFRFNGGSVWGVQALAQSSRRNALDSLFRGVATVSGAFLAASVKPILAEDTSPTAIPPCDDNCMRERRKRILERRAMMQQSRTNTKRSDMFELSRQRAALYNTTYQGASCPPGVPCL